MASWIDEINTLAEAWFALDDDKDAARKEKLSNDLFLKLYGRKEKYDEVIGDFWEQRMPNFNPNAGKFYSYFTWSCERIIIDNYNAEDKKSRRTTTKEQPDGTLKKVRAQHHRLDAPLADDATQTYKEFLADDGSYTPEAQLLTQGNRQRIQLSFLNLIVQFQSSLSSRQNNPQHIAHMRNFFTERLMATFQEIHVDDLSLYLQEELRLQKALNPVFIAFVLGQPYDSLEALYHAQALETCTFPLPNEVYRCYWKEIEGAEISPSALSQQRKQFNQFLKTYLEWM